MSAPAYDKDVSTFYDPQYALESMYPAYTIINPSTGEIEIRRDYLAQMSRIIRKITSYTPYLYQGYETLTTISYNFYKNTTLVHLILMYNSIPHRLELIPHTIIKIPDLNQLKTIMVGTTSISSQSASKQSNVGKTVLLQ